MPAAKKLLTSKAKSNFHHRLKWVFLYLSIDLPTNLSSRRMATFCFVANTFIKTSTIIPLIAEDRSAYSLDKLANREPINKLNDKIIKIETRATTPKIQLAVKAKNKKTANLINKLKNPHSIFVVRASIALAILLILLVNFPLKLSLKYPAPCCNT